MTILKKLCKQILKLLLIAPILMVLFFLFYQYNNRLFVFEAKLIWPQSKFNSELFQTAQYESRRAMVADILDSDLFLGKPITTVKEQLGAPDGDYYYGDSNYTYALTKKGNADWILTFISNDMGIVERIVIRKSCCSTSRRVLDFFLFDVLGTFK